MMHRVLAIVLVLVFAATVRSDITTDLEIHWALDDGAGTTATDSSGNANDGTLNNTPTWAAGKVGAGSLTFDGSSDESVTLASFGTAVTGTAAFW
jgi:hypothetical protein